MSETGVDLKSEPSLRTEIIPPDSLLVMEQGYVIPPRMQSAYQRSSCRLYTVIEGGGEIPPDKPAHPLGYTPTDTTVTFLQPNEWTLATTESFSVQDRDPRTRYAVVNKDGKKQAFRLNKLREWQLKKKGY